MDGIVDGIVKATPFLRHGRLDLALELDRGLGLSDIEVKHVTKIVNVLVAHQLGHASSLHL